MQNTSVPLSTRPTDDPSQPIGAGRLLGLAAGPALALTTLALPVPEGLAPEGWRMVGLAAWMVVWWLSEAVPLPATALLPLIYIPMFGIDTMRAAAVHFADPLIFLFLGGFMLAAAVQNVGLHRRIALHIVAAVGDTPERIVLGFMLATAFVSMWISNTASSIMMYTVGLSVVEFVRHTARDENAVRRFGVALMLGIAYAASIGGVGTLIGTPPNAMLASFLNNTYGLEISFFTWMLVGVPVVLILLPIAWVMLSQVLFRTEAGALGKAGQIVRDEIRTLGPMTAGERLVGAVFLAAAAGWMLRMPLASLTGLPLNDAMIALSAALVLFAVPVSRRHGHYALTWDVVKGLPWNVLILFGGGLALAGGFATTGLAEWIGSAVAGIEVSTVAMILLILVAIAYLSEVTSNTASTAAFLPILGAVAVGLGLEAQVLTVPVALGASMAFMMPVATPPNAIVFSYDRMRLSDMVRAGAALKVIGIATAFAVFMLVGPDVLGFSLGDG
ncbi:sodium-dependent dicarboxylate transporter 2/3/5 [Rhodovulum imhoffii]|uniref:Sodium-dependent dicarboxylate transporter 2/3/5 n=1 Tax=Rhodovulum imhoffii TaxID=365340 RepID=A0A2T5BSF4_9RHOB|nr:DASS family sodium-coupled anion symporter [Rhodovulum imhoffii]MBK5933488.1 anion transporter [Rhodovulum imhoffii]PTN02275.1 sodium-dependent dicarboxylate transporter 2/3/5 [Rhodovulum imhoffii]